MRSHRRIERAEDARVHLGREPPVQHRGAVVFVPEGQAPVLSELTGFAARTDTP